MAYSTTVLRQANQMLQSRRSRHAVQRGQLHDKIREDIPRIAQIQRQLRLTSARAVGLALRSGEDPAPAMQRLRQENLSLQEELVALLTGEGYPADAMDDIPLCSRCGDSGWMGSRMCQCLKDLCTQAQVKELTQVSGYCGQSFEGFSFDYYSTQYQEIWKRSARKNIEMIFTICKAYAEKFGSDYLQNLYLWGGTGLGKTHLATCIAHTVAERGYSVTYDTATKLFAHFETHKFHREQEESHEAKDSIRRYENCDLLVIDDLGSELVTSFIQTTIYQLIESRLASRKATVITANLSISHLEHMYSAQVASRLNGEYRALPFFGEDIRILKRNQ